MSVIFARVSRVSGFFENMTFSKEKIRTCLAKSQNTKIFTKTKKIMLSPITYQ